MTEQEDKRRKLLDLLRDKPGDPEAQHGDAEDALCDYLRAKGDFELASAWSEAEKRQGWWYA